MASMGARVIARVRANVMASVRELGLLLELGLMLWLA